jgi:predicted PurR-regulated permease PerM
MQDPAPVDRAIPARPDERRAFGVLALVAVAALLRLALPVGVGLFLGALLAFALEPIHTRLRRRNIGPGAAALACALGAAALISSTVLATTTLLVTRGGILLSSLQDRIAPGGSVRVLAERAMVRLTPSHVSAADVLERLESETLSLGSRAAGFAAQLAGLTVSALLTLFFMTLSAYCVLRYWSEIVTRSERILPFEQRHTHALFEQFRSVGREVLLGTVVTGVVQGLFAAFGYWITGVPEPAFFGALTSLASLIPGIGTVLVWLPIGIVQIVAGHAGAGVAELVYSGLTVGIVSDYLLRPRLVGSERSVPSIFTFIGLFGGVEAFGVVGLILGPVIVTLSLAILRTYERQVAGRAPS